ncbi:MAG: hypothetical protein IKP72_15320 [Clostridia bacterium]|nr:hypothetical protein [Clostridia bacterium]
MGFGATQSKDAGDEARQLWNYIYTLEKQLRYALAHIDGDNIVPGTVDANKLIPGTIQRDNLKKDTIAATITKDRVTAQRVTAEVLKVIEASMKKATIDALQASMVRIVETEIGRANIDWARINTLVAEMARVAKATITTADIEWAEIEDLHAAIADIASAAITTADIDWGHVKDLITGRAIITEGEAGELYIARLAVTEANMVSLTVGELVVKGEDGSFYALTVDEDGNIDTEKKEIENSDVADASIHGGEKLIEGSVTAQTLNAQDIFGDSAVIRQLIAENLDVDTLFARQATLDKINALDITSNESIRLYVENQQQISTWVRITEDGLEIGKEGDTARFQADNRTLSVANVKTERVGIAQTLDQDEEWAWIATKSGLGLKYIGPEVSA